MPDEAQQGWWRLAGRVPVRPVAVFTELRDDSAEAAQARQEPVLAIILVAGAAGVLATTLAGVLALSGVELAVWTFLGGALEGFALYFVVGALLYVGGNVAGSTWSYRHARHVLAYAAVPLALSLPVWVVRVAVDAELDLVLVAVLAWCAALVVTGVTVLHAWPWWRGLAASALALLVPVLVLLRAYGVV